MHNCNRQVALEGRGLEREGAKRLKCQFLAFRDGMLPADILDDRGRGQSHVSRVWLLKISKP